MSHGVVNLLFVSTQLEHADKTYSNIKKIFVNPTDILNKECRQTVIYFESQTYTESELRGIIPLSLYLDENDDLVIWLALTTTQVKQLTVLFINFIEHPYPLQKDATLLLHQ